MGSKKVRVKKSYIDQNYRSMAKLQWAIYEQVKKVYITNLEQFHTKHHP